MTGNALLHQPAPDFRLINDNNQPRTLAELARANGTLLVFVYGSYCSTCVQTLISLSRATTDFDHHEIGLAIISLDEWAHSNTFKLGLHMDIPFDILADPDGAVHKAYGAYNQSFGAAFIRPDGTVAGTRYDDRYPGTRTLFRLMVEDSEASR
jgi:peroxiredoxin